MAQCSGLQCPTKQTMGGGSWLWDEVMCLSSSAPEPGSGRGDSKAFLASGSATSQQPCHGKVLAGSSRRARRDAAFLQGECME